MKRIFRLFCSAILVACVSCGGSHKNDDESAADELRGKTDTEIVEYMVSRVSPDSVARFICDASIGRASNGVVVKSMPEAVTAAYNHYKDADLVTFSDEFDNYPKRLPLPLKMKIYIKAGEVNAESLGYQLGLEYVNSIRERKMSVSEIDRELEALKSACGDDKDTYRRFVVGFKTVLKIDQGKDIPSEVYQKYINMSEE